MLIVNPEEKKRSTQKSKLLAVLKFLKLLVHVIGFSDVEEHQAYSFSCSESNI